MAKPKAKAPARTARARSAAKRRARPGAKSRRARPAAKPPARVKARPKHKFTLSHHREEDFKGGLRTYAWLFAGNIALRRESRYYRSVALRAEAGKEIRVFGLAGWLRALRSLKMSLLVVWAGPARLPAPLPHAHTAFGFAVAALSWQPSTRPRLQSHHLTG
jgi:hypothetical protein